MAGQGPIKNNHDGRKVEPKPKGINPGWVGQLGNMQGTHTMDDPNSVYGSFEKMHKDRGYKSPPVGSECHHSGSQGKHK